MSVNLERLKYLQAADVYKGGRLAGHLVRTEAASTTFTYDVDYLGAGLPSIATTLPIAGHPVTSPGGGLPAFFSGLLPEGHRLTVLRDATKTSFDDELTLLMAVGGDVPGDVKIVPRGESPAPPRSLADVTDPGELDFAVLAESVDLRALPGVQPKASASMLTSPVSFRNGHFILKLDPPNHKHLVQNEAAHLLAAKTLKLPIASATVVHDKNGLSGLLVRRFDRRKSAEGWASLPLEDGAQVMGLPPAAKYGVSSEAVVHALTATTKASVVAARNLYLQFVFAWLTGNGDLHAKNVSVLGNGSGDFAIAPIYDIPCTLLYGDETMALSVSGRTKNIRKRHWAALAHEIGLPKKAAESADALALRAAGRVDLSALPFSGSPLNRAIRELRQRRAELAD
ncbi:type II toxin-antitoxin system HipA family toxin [Paenarthrobacter sp. NPDC058040]|uniref:type II toxin-antitoxin system HipA family toxin n=1 Tax=unclassified Paenarthrobacter TaxID=2634190 RepID=UPI0036DAF365